LVSFEVFPDKIILETNEEGFTETDVRQICSIGKSWKKQNQGYIGEKGLGFKSVFQVASKVHIQSNAFSFSLESDEEASIEKRLGIVTPIPEDDIIPPSMRPLTRMSFTLKNKIPYDELVNHFTTLTPCLLLFLSKLTEIKIVIHKSDWDSTTCTIFRKSSDQATGVVNLSKLSGLSGNKEERQFHVRRKHAEALPNDAARPNMNDCEVVLAFPFDKDGHLRMSTQHDVFAFLPVCRVGFNVS